MIRSLFRLFPVLNEYITTIGSSGDADSTLNSIV